MNAVDPTVGVAVVIVTWNSAKFIDKVLNCLMRQTVLPSKIYVIDNASSDAEILANCVSHFPLCELKLFTTNLGFAAANNWAIHQAKDMQFIALLNPDAFAEPYWLESLLNAARTNLNVAAFGSRLLKDGDPRYLDGAGDSLGITGKPSRRGHGKLAAGLFTRSELVFSPCAAACLYRRQALIEIDGFDESFFCYVEDVDLAFRLLLLGHRSMYVQDSVVRHIGSALTGVRSDFSIYYGQRNLVWNFVKNMPPVLFWLFLLPHLFSNLAYILVAPMMGYGNVVYRAKRDALKKLPEVWKQREAIQAKRRVSITTVARRLRWIGL
jgi:GT2 family glycosyltransferase